VRSHACMVMVGPFCEHRSNNRFVILFNKKSSATTEVTEKRKTNPDLVDIIGGVKYGFDKVPQVPSFGSKAFRMRTHFHCRS
jgi:hypothetical protein